MRGTENGGREVAPIHAACVIPRRGFLLSAAAALTLSSCGRSAKRVIGVIPKATSHMFFMSVHAGADQAAKDFKLDILWNGPQNETDFARQIEVVDSMIAQRVSAIAISACDATPWLPHSNAPSKPVFQSLFLIPA